MTWGPFLRHSFAALRKFLAILLVLAFIGLGYLGSQPPEGGYVIAARILTAYYFIHFLIIMPLVGVIETPKPLPGSISEAVLKDAEIADIYAYLQSIAPGKSAKDIELLNH